MLTPPWLRTLAVTIAILTTTSVLVGCGDAKHSPTAAESAQSSSPTDTNGHTYLVMRTSIEGSTDDHLGNWDVEIGEITGGEPTVVAAFNSASRAAAQKEIDDLKDVAAPGLQWNLVIRGDVTFRSVAIVQLVISTSHYGAVPTVTPTAIVIDSRTAKPITLADLFTDEQAGLQRLSEQTELQFGKTHSYHEGWAPKPENFANWLPTADGMEIRFAPYQFGARTADTITVPWPALSDLLAPDMAGLMHG